MRKKHTYFQSSLQIPILQNGGDANFLQKKFVYQPPFGNILHCTKRTQNKTRIDQWRLLLSWSTSSQFPSESYCCLLF